MRYRITYLEPSTIEVEAENEYMAAVVLGQRKPDVRIVKVVRAQGPKPGVVQDAVAQPKKAPQVRCKVCGREMGKNNIRRHLATHTRQELKVAGA